MSKQDTRERRGRKTKVVINKSGLPRIVAHRSGKHIYAQIIVAGNVLASASTLDKTLKPTLTGNKVEQATQVGRLLGARAKEKGLEKAAFDRAGYRYHGRIKALADGAREAGLDF